MALLAAKVMAVKDESGWTSTILKGKAQMKGRMQVRANCMGPR